MTLKEAVQSFQAASLRRRVALRYAASNPLDLSLAEAFAKKAEKRFEENKRIYQSMKKLRGDREKYGKGYDRLLKNGNEASIAAQAVIRKYEGGSGKLKGQAKRAYDAALEWLDICVSFWGQYSNDFGAGSAEERLSNTYAGAQKLEAALKKLPEALQGKDEPLDESWRSH